MKVFAHRGASGDYPENTILAFDKALALDVYGIELDKISGSIAKQL